MADFTKCRYGSRLVSIEDAIAIKKKLGGSYLIGVFQCVECGCPVTPNKGYENGRKYFAHANRNPMCSLSHSSSRLTKHNPATLPSYRYADISVMEGVRREITLLVSQRNRFIVEKVKERENYTCQACNFRFENNGMYVIDCHHTTPVTATGFGPVLAEQLICLCPNCHRIAHTSNPPYSLPQIKKILAKSRL